MSYVEVCRAGSLSSLQDLGRPAAMSWGVARGGAVDRRAAILANVLVGNSPGAAVLENTLIGDSLEFPETTCLAWTGADMATQVEWRGMRWPLPTHRPVLLRSGSVLRSTAARSGCRSYLAVAGGFDVPELLGSRSTHLRAGFGGWQGRGVTAGDRLPIGAPTEIGARIRQRLEVELSGEIGWASPAWFHRGQEFVEPSRSAPSGGTRETACPVRILPGSQTRELAQESDLYVSEYQIQSQSDRMGYRLTGQVLTLRQPTEILSAGLTAGTLQLPPNGQLILILADGAPTGGYPRVGHVISADLGRVAQLRPGEWLRFSPIDLDSAHSLLRAQAAELTKIRNSIRLWAAGD